MCENCGDLFTGIAPRLEMRRGVHPATGERDAWLVVRGRDQVVLAAFGPDQQREALEAFSSRIFDDRLAAPGETHDGAPGRS